MKDIQPLRVLVVDDHPVVRSGLREFVSALDWMEPVGEAKNGLEAVEWRIRALGKPVTIIALTSFHEQDLVQRALKAGAAGYLLKNVGAEELAAAIRAAHSGRTVLAEEATAALVQATSRGPDVGFDLTQRELETLALLVQGYSNAEIADRLSITMATVKHHLTNIFTKLGARNRVEAASIAFEHHLVDKQT
jgi:NarL family two-component system response regulator LiaR